MDKCKLYASSRIHLSDEVENDKQQEYINDKQHQYLSTAKKQNLFVITLDVVTSFQSMVRKRKCQCKHPRNSAAGAYFLLHHN